MGGGGGVKPPPGLARVTERRYQTEKSADLTHYFSRGVTFCVPKIKIKIGRGKWGKADYLRNSMQYFFTECLYLTKDFSIG